jgi:hypothetical protein
MIIYCYVLLVLLATGFGAVITKQDPERFGRWLGTALVEIPLIGRILGWW